MDSQQKGFVRYQLDERILEAIKVLKFREPTTVQHRVIPLVIQGKNVLVEAATGTGKTAAYGFPMISKLNLDKRSTQMLVLAPTRELATQVYDALLTFTTNPKFKVEAIFGGGTLQDSVRKVKSAPHVIVAVPGRLKDVVRLGKFDYLWRDIKMVVLDEADKLMESGFQELVDGILNNISNNAQYCMFSATITEDAINLARDRFKAFMVIRLEIKEAMKNISFFSVHVKGGDKEGVLGELIKQEKVKQALIFCSHRKEVESLSTYLRASGFITEAYHGRMDQNERISVLRRFRSGQINFLVATDLAARGLDIEELPAVIHFNCPEETDVYIHRTGRTGRANRRGKCYVFLSSEIDKINLNRFQTEIAKECKELKIDLSEKIQTSQHNHEKQVKVRLNRGKKDKFRLSDILGYLIKNLGLVSKDVGTITLYPDHSIVDLTLSAAKKLEETENIKIKGLTVKAARFTKDDRSKIDIAVRKKMIGVRDKEKILRRKEKKEQEILTREPKTYEGKGKTPERKEAPFKGKKENKSRGSVGKSSNRGKKTRGK